MFRTSVPFIFILLFIQGSLSAQLKYPITKKTDQTDTYFGTVVADPYRWLEDDRSLATEAWVNEQNDLTNSYLAKIPFRDSLKSRMTQLWNFAQYNAPIRCGNNYFYYRKDGVQNQPILFYMRSLEYVPMSYFDPNKLSADGTTSILQTVPSGDGKHVAFVISESGSDWNSIRIKEVKTMKTLPEVMTRIKFSDVSWWKDGFFYSRYDVPADNQSLTKRNEFHKVYYHKINTEQSEDSLVFEDKEHPLRNFGATVTDDERYLIITSRESSSGNNLFINDLSKPGSKPVQVVDWFENEFTIVGNSGDDLIFLTDYKAPKKKLILINSKALKPVNWKDLVPEQSEILKGAIQSWNGLLLHYMKDASSKVYGYDMKGVKKFEIPFGKIGTVEELNGSVNDTLAWISYTTFTAPPVIYFYNMKNNLLYEKFKTKLPYNDDDYITRQVFYPSKDGTKIPMFLVHKKGYKPDGKTPTLLFGYGGFNISKTPEFKAERLVFLEHGGLLALPCLRGGGEFGSEWHDAGTKLKKQNVFDDFIAAAEYLTKEGYTNPQKLAIGGRSNGGLLVGAVMTQRPELFKVAIPTVGVMDMLRFHKFTIGWAWTNDYGSSEDSTQFKAIYAYSPLHNIKKISYPATLVTTSDHDDRVVPAHSFKFTATMQENQQGDAPILIRVDKNAGHGGGVAVKPTGKLIDEQSDVFSFIFYNLGMKYEN